MRPKDSARNGHQEDWRPGAHFRCYKTAQEQVGGKQKAKELGKLIPVSIHFLLLTSYRDN